MASHSCREFEAIVIVGQRVGIAGSVLNVYFGIEVLAWLPF